MRKTEAVSHFGGVPKLAGLLGVTRQAIYKWPDEVPELYQYKLHYLSRGKLRIRSRARAAA